MHRFSKLWTEAVAVLVATGLSGCATVSAPVQSSGDDFARALDAMRSADHATAETLLTEISDREPDHAGAWVNLGIVLAHLERETEAVAALQQAIVLDPALAAAHNELGVLHRRAGRLAAAESAYREALAIDPEHAVAHHNLGVLYDLYLGRPDEALEHYRRFTELEENDQQVQRWIAELQRRLPVREAHNR